MTGRSEPSATAALRRIPQWQKDGWLPGGSGRCVCPTCGKKVSTNAKLRYGHRSVCEREDRRQRYLTRPPCQRCVRLAQAHQIRVEMVQPMPELQPPPLGLNREPCCYDCQAADNCLKRGIPVRLRSDDPDDFNRVFLMARIAVGNDRQEQLRLPGVPMGLVLEHITKPSRPGDLEIHHEWLRLHKHFGVFDEDERRSPSEDWREP